MPDTTLEELLLQNPDAPTNDDFARDFARRILEPSDQQTESAIHLDTSDGPVDLQASDDPDATWCGESTLGLLEAVMASDLLSDQARGDINAMIDAAVPTLERTKTIGHFRFFWTENNTDDSRHNTNETNIDATGAILNDCWNRYVADFRRPKANLVGGVRRLDVRVYYNSSLHGSTSSSSNSIYLNSHTVVNDDCRRQTTSAHELFHRVEYTYGYITGTANQKWWVEALGSWSQEYYAPDVDDYISRVNSGLATPDRGLLTRSYDACHFWKYVGEQLTKRSGAITTEHQAIDEILDRYAINGLDAKAAVGTVSTNRMSRSFNGIFQDWSKANIIKDLDNAGLRYEYDEDEKVTNSCGRNYGPYRHVLPATRQTISGNSFSWTSGVQTVASYGTAYHEFVIDPSVSSFEVRLDGNTDGGAGTFSSHLVMIKDDRWRVIYNKASVVDDTRVLKFDPGTYDRCVLVVNGLGVGGSYTVGINACVTGVWRDRFGFVWRLRQAGTDISGTVATRGCGSYRVSGSVDGTDIELRATGGCCDFTYTGTITDCSSGSGDWTNDCSGSGTWSMSKVDAADADLEPELETHDDEFADDPTSMRG